MDANSLLNVLIMMLRKPAALMIQVKKSMRFSSSWNRLESASNDAFPAASGRCIRERSRPGCVRCPIVCRCQRSRSSNRSIPGYSHPKAHAAGLRSGLLSRHDPFLTQVKNPVGPRLNIGIGGSNEEEIIPQLKGDRAMKNSRFKLKMIPLAVAVLAAGVAGEAIAAGPDGGARGAGVAGQGQMQSQQPGFPVESKMQMLEQERMRLLEREQILARDEARLHQMIRLRTASQQQLRETEQGVADEGVRLQTQRQLAGAIASETERQQRLLQGESGQGALQAMNLERAEVRTQLQILQQEMAQIRDREKLALQEKDELQQRIRLLEQLRTRLAEAEKLLSQQQLQLEKRIGRMTSLEEMLQQREQLWRALEEEGS